MKIEVSNGEIIDKISILFIKQQNILDDKKINNINKELNSLTDTAKPMLENEKIIYFYKKLMDINQQIWDAENTIRQLEHKKCFDGIFIETARSIYKLNDERASIKKEINRITHSLLVEEKYHTPLLPEIEDKKL